MDANTSLGQPRPSYSHDLSILPNGDGSRPHEQDPAPRQTSYQDTSHPETQSIVDSPSSQGLSRKQRRSHFVTEITALPDFITAGLITSEQAELYFSTFFQGCDHYVPIFDPVHDTLQGVRSRSSLLFAAICTVGCRVVSGTDSHQWRLLNFHHKRMLSSTMSTPRLAALETVQALLVRACYSSERSLLVASATRMAIDIGLPDSYDDLSTRLVNKHHLQDSADLMRRTRTWLHLLVLGHILHVDAGDLLTFKFVGDARRSRILLDNPHATSLDRFLFAQVELNVLRANILASLATHTNDDDEDIVSIVRDSKIDIDLWYSDWERIVHAMKPPAQWMSINLRVQKCWAETMALCRAVRDAGVENVDFMSPAQRSILVMAKESLHQHLETIIAEPRSYLHNLRYAMDFVWAKCAFCYLLLLKLCILLPSEDSRLNDNLVACGAVLSNELSEAGGGTMSGIRSNTGKMYLQLLQTGTDKFTRALRGDFGTSQAGSGGEADGQAMDSPEERFHTGAQNEVDSFVPDQFVFEWDFPGLTLFSSSTTGIGWLDDILLGALNGGGEFYGFMGCNGEPGE